MVLLDGQGSILVIKILYNHAGKWDVFYRDQSRWELPGLLCSFWVLLSGRWAQRPSSPMSTDSNMSPAITHRRPRRHKQNQCGEPENQPTDVFNDGTEKILNRGLKTAGWPNMPSVPPDSCMPLGFSSHTPHWDYKARGATLPRMGSGENRGRRGSTGTHRVKDGTCEQRENQDKHRSPPRGKGSSRNRQHSGSRWMVSIFTLLKCEEVKCYSYLSVPQNLGIFSRTVVHLSH